MKPEDINNVQIRKYVILYCFAFLSHGFFSGNVGPLIPYLSALLQKEETQFSFLFMARTIGNIIGIAAYRFLQIKSQNIKQHKVLAIYSLISAIAMILFVNWQTILGQWFVMIIIGSGTFGIFTIVNVCLVYISQKNPKWLSVGHAFYGIVAFLAPMIIIEVQLNMFYINFCLYALVAALSLLIPTPKHSSQIQMGDTRTSNIQATQESQKNIILLKQGSFKLSILVSLSLFLIVGVQITFLGWISTYAIMSSNCYKNEANIYVSIFWVASTLIRFTNAALKTKNSIKLKAMLISILFSGVLCLFLHYNGHSSLVAVLGSLLFGMSCSGVYPVILTVPTQFGIKFKKHHQIANMMSSTLFSGLLAGFTGMFMKLNIECFFYSLVFMTLLQLITAALMFKILKREANSEQPIKSVQIKEFLVE